MRPAKKGAAVLLHPQKFQQDKNLTENLKELAKAVECFEQVIQTVGFRLPSGFRSIHVAFFLRLASG
jgi:hypothetical protein